MPNVHFVLGTHIGQLENSVRAAYGVDIDARTYLQKFIQLTFQLADEGRHRNEKVANKYVAYLRSNLEFAPEDREVVDAAVDLITMVVLAQGLSLRHIERMMSNLALALAFTKPNRLRPGSIIGGLCILRVLAPNLYRRAKEGTLTFSEAASVLFTSPMQDGSETRVEWHDHWWRFCLDPGVSDEIKEGMRRTLIQYNVERERIVPLIANSIVDQLSPTE